MKHTLIILGLVSALFTGSSLQAAEPKLKEYPLKICLVSDNKLGPWVSPTSSRTKNSVSNSAVSHASKSSPKNR